MAPSESEPPKTQAEVIRELLHDPEVRELLSDALVDHLETRRPPSLWERLRPMVAGVASALVTLLAFFLPSLQEQWDRYEARQVIQRYVELGRDFLRDGRYKLAEETFAKAFELSENKRLDIEEERLAARVEQVNADPEWGKRNPEGIGEGDFLYLIQMQKHRHRQRDLAATLGSYGVFLSGERRAAEAESAFQQAIRLDPAGATAYVNLGNLLSDGGRMREAEAAYRRAVALDSSSAGAFYDLGVLLAQTGRAPEAETALRRAVQLDRHDPDALRLLIEVLEKGGRTDEAAALRPELARRLAERAKAPPPGAPPSLKELEDSSE